MDSEKSYRARIVHWPLARRLELLRTMSDGIRIDVGDAWRQLGNDRSAEIVTHLYKAESHIADAMRLLGWRGGRL